MSYSHYFDSADLKMILVTSGFLMAVSLLLHLRDWSDWVHPQ